VFALFSSVIWDCLPLDGIYFFFDNYDLTIGNAARNFEHTSGATGLIGT
jgi:hypothetical protein